MSIHTFLNEFYPADAPTAKVMVPSILMLRYRLPLTPTGSQPSI